MKTLHYMKESRHKCHDINQNSPKKQNLFIFIYLHEIYFKELAHTTVTVRASKSEIHRAGWQAGTLIKS